MARGGRRRRGATCGGGAVTRRLGLVALVALVVIAAVIWRCRGGAQSPGESVRDAPRFEVQRLRDTFTRQRPVVQALAARFPRTPAAAATDRAQLLVKLLTPRCFIGPTDLCEALVGPAAACVDGDASACLAVGQYIADTPPRSGIAHQFFKRGCALGDAEACARSKAPAAGEVIDCDVDLMRCARQARDQNDRVRSAEACERGVADACDYMMKESAIAGDRIGVRDYLTKGCQLGSPMLCALLGQRLSPTCKGDCLPPDAERAAAALAFACESGLDDACASVAP